jgi:hypothetical protein
MSLSSDGTRNLAQDARDVNSAFGVATDAMHARGPDFNAIAPGYRWSVTPTWRHNESSEQAEHRGREPVQMDLPKGTRRSLISIQ